MVINTDNLVSITEANQNFSRVARMVDENGAAVIAGIAPRRNVFVRPPMANLDVLFLVASTTQPTPSTLVLDKLSAIAVDKGVQPVIVCTKGDLAEAEFLRSAYEKSTLPFIRIDHRTGEGLDEIRNWINGRLCAFCGYSLKIPLNVTNIRTSGAGKTVPMAIPKMMAITMRANKPILIFFILDFICRLQK